MAAGRNDYGVLFPTSVVGSLPRPEFVKELISDDKVSPEDYDRRMEAAVRYAVALQEHAGLDVLTDGEWWRKSYIGVIAELAHGFDVGVAPDGRPWTVVTGKLSPKKPGTIAKEVRLLRRLTTRMIKATLPAPALLGERMWEEGKSNAAYPTREAFVEACVPVLRKELELLRDAGATIVQIDDPHLCLFVDPDVRGKYDNADRAADFAVDMVNAVVSGFEKDLKLAVHLCRRAGARARGEQRHAGGYDPILRQLNRLKVNHLTMEFTAPEAGDLSVLKKLRDDYEVGLGCVGTTPGVVDSPDEIFARVKKALDYLPPERITLNPDCGFAPGSAAKVSIDEVYQKLKNEVEAARRLRDLVG